MTDAATQPPNPLARFAIALARLVGWIRFQLHDLRACCLAGDEFDRRAARHVRGLRRFLTFDEIRDMLETIRVACLRDWLTPDDHDALCRRAIAVLDQNPDADFESIKLHISTHARWIAEARSKADQTPAPGFSTGETSGGCPTHPMPGEPGESETDL